MNEPRLFHVLVVDDHPLIRIAMTEIINHEPEFEVCGQADAPAAALEQVRSTHPDVALLDLSLNGLPNTGIELIRAIHAVDSHVRILVVSMHDASRYATMALEAGAMGYVHKQEAADNVIEGIRTLLRGNIYLSEHAQPICPSDARP